MFDGKINHGWHQRRCVNYRRTFIGSHPESFFSLIRTIIQALHGGLEDWSASDSRTFSLFGYLSPWIDLFCPATAYRLPPPPPPSPPIAQNSLMQRLFIIITIGSEWRLSVLSPLPSIKLFLLFALPSRLRRSLYPYKETRMRARIHTCVHTLCAWESG